MGFSQNRVPPPPCYANDNTGAGGVIGMGLFLHQFNEDDIRIDFGIGEDFNGVLVIYIHTNAPGRHIIDETVDDSNDAHRIAITNSDISGFGSTITFAPGFEAAYAIAIDTNSGGIYAIPSSGNVENGGLNYIASVNSSLTPSSQGDFGININYADIGITQDQDFNFVAIYVGNDGYTYDEGYGEGLTAGIQGADNVTFTNILYIAADTAGCGFATLNNPDNDYNTIDAKYFDNKLHISGVNEEVTVRLYDLMGRDILEMKQQINGPTAIPIDLLENQVQFIVIEGLNKRKVLKVISTSK